MKTFRKTMFWVVFLAAVPVALAQGTYTQIDYPGAVLSVAEGIDTAGDITGWYLDSSGLAQGFLLTDGVFTVIDKPGSLDTYLFGINDVGQVVGTTHEGTGFVYDLQTQTFSPIKYPGAGFTSAISINNTGTIVGQFDNHSDLQGFQFDGSTYSKIMPKGGNDTYVGGITAAGEIVGTTSTSSGTVNFALSGGKFRQITIPNAPTAEVLGINPLGTALTGSYEPVAGTAAGFVYQRGKLRTLTFPGGSTFTQAVAINAAGQVVGSFIDSTGAQHGFLWTPPADAPKP